LAKEQVIVIDEDLGVSGSGFTERSGFARMTDMNRRRNHLWTYVYDDAGKLLYEASSYREQAQQVEILSQEPPEGSKGDPRRTPR
jgi:hypothetical protein